MNGVTFCVFLSAVSTLQREIHANAVKQHDRKILVVFRDGRTFTHFCTKTYLALENFRRTISENRSKHGLGVAGTHTLMPIQQRNHRTVDVRLEMVVDASAETDQTHARLHTEMVAEHNLKISSNKAATALQETR